MNFLNDFAKKLDYDTLEIYSYNRGELLNSFLESLEKERQDLLRLMENEKDFNRALALNKRVKQIEKYRTILKSLNHDVNEIE